jgi:hypothetical protein
VAFSTLAAKASCLSCPSLVVANPCEVKSVGLALTPDLITFASRVMPGSHDGTPYAADTTLTIREPMAQT